MVRTLAILLTTLCVGFAPAPPYRAHRWDLKPGVWEVTFGGTKTYVTFREDGTHSYSWFNTTYEGHWKWYPGIRTLVVTERTTPSIVIPNPTTLTWEAVIDRENKGWFCYRDGTPPMKSEFSMRRKK